MILSLLLGFISFSFWLFIPLIYVRTDLDLDYLPHHCFLYLLLLDSRIVYSFWRLGRANGGLLVWAGWGLLIERMTSGIHG